MDTLNQTADSGATTQEAADKTFTQDQVNAIVQERLTRERTRHEEAQADLAKREQEIAKREFALHATEILKEKKLPIEIMDALNTTDKESFAKAVDIISRHLEPKMDIAPPVGGVIYGNSRLSGADPVRAAMGLKNRK